VITPVKGCAHGVHEEIGQAGAVTRTELGRWQFGSLSVSSRRGGGSPRLERFISEDAECVAGDEMALDVEGIVNGGVNGQESLGHPGDLNRCILRSRRRVG
jgi:hypothetical protein